jgi:hypothetical protein
MNENAKEDQNRVPVTLCVNSDERDKTIMLRVDTASPQIAPFKRDQNRVTALGFADSTNTTDEWTARTDTDNRLIVKFI